MALHPDFPNSPHAILDPAIRWFPADEAFRDTTMDKLVAAGSYKEKQPPAIKGTGYVVDAMEAALWAFYNSVNFRDGLLMAVNLGDDAPVV